MLTLVPRYQVSQPKNNVERETWNVERETWNVEGREPQRVPSAESTRIIRLRYLPRHSMFQLNSLQ